MRARAVPMDPLKLDALATSMAAWFRAGRWKWGGWGAPLVVPNAAQIQARIQEMAEIALTNMQDASEGQGKRFVGGPVRSARLSVTVEHNPGAPGALDWRYSVVLEALSEDVLGARDLVLPTIAQGGGAP